MYACFSQKVRRSSGSLIGYAANRAGREMIPKNGYRMYIHMQLAIVKYAYCHSFEFHPMCARRKTALRKNPLAFLSFSAAVSDCFLSLNL